MSDAPPQREEHIVSEVRRRRDGTEGAVLTRRVHRDATGRLTWLGGGVLYPSRQAAEAELGPLADAPRADAPREDGR